MLSQTAIWRRRFIKPLKIVKRIAFVCIGFKSVHGSIADGENYFKHKNILIASVIARIFW